MMENCQALAPLKSQGEEDPVILQALADALMDAYHTRELIQNARGNDTGKRRLGIFDVRYSI